MTTPYHAKYFAHELTRISSGDSYKLSRSLFDASVDLNPHQIEAALFAFRSPLSKGVILADEVGLGKTIEAGLVLCQHWVERRRKLLIICPASLRKQWSIELEEKFHLPSKILDSSTYKESLSNGNSNPLFDHGVIIVSFQFANRLKDEIKLIPWDLVVIDEAHKLRNVYKNNNKMGQGIKWSIEDRKKLLLTATPLQNSLLELYGLSLLIDDHLFGDVTAFRTRYTHSTGDLDELKHRLKQFCHRTLRSQVLEYIQYTERKAITAPFHPSDDEQALYEAVSSFLMREDTYAIPQRQRTLTTLILRKLLASSSHAIGGTLATIKQRLELMTQDSHAPNDDKWLEEIVELDEMEVELIDEGIEVEEEQQELTSTTIDVVKLKAEIQELERYILWARSIRIDSKTRALLQAILHGFDKLHEMGANRKALIFTESRRTQEYLKSFLEGNGYAGKIVLFNGTNTDGESKQIYQMWLERNKATSKISGSKSADLRAALIEHFREQADIMIATESAAEGVNLQFCSLVINYDLPWNPQRIEQRIGRCHRYGQQHDVVVINFLNKRNEADQRVFELLQEKFNLFSGVLGASDEVLGSIESGVDFEKRILSIYQQCRTQEEIETAFLSLRRELEETITNKLENTRRSLLEHFDEDVATRFKVKLDDTNIQLDRISRMFWNVTKVVLQNHAEFQQDELRFHFHGPLDTEQVELGDYQLISRRARTSASGITYRLSHPLGEYVTKQGKLMQTPVAEVKFDITHHPHKVSLVEQLIGVSGYIILTKLSIHSFETEEYLLFSGFTDDEMALDQEICEKLFYCNGTVITSQISSSTERKLTEEAERHVAAATHKSLSQNQKLFQEERDRLEKWADDLIVSAEKELSDTKAKIKEMKRQERLSITLAEQHEYQLKIKELERQQRRQRQRIFDVEDEIVAKRDQLIDELELRMKQRTEKETLFIIRWTVV